ncbi:MAG TPA: PA2779 family protein [Nitrospirales bacterium]|nr:PA2779 family protein [Nitrospirales bacterium]
MIRRVVIALVLLSGATGAQASPDLTMSAPEFQRELESRLIAQRLSGLGLGPSDVQARLDGLTDEQIHQLARNVDATASAGGGMLALIGLGAILTLVMLARRANRPAHGFSRGIG